MSQVGHRENSRILPAQAALSVEVAHFVANVSQLVGLQTAVRDALTPRQDAFSIFVTKWILGISELALCT